MCTSHIALLRLVFTGLGLLILGAILLYLAWSAYAVKEGKGGLVL